MQVLTAVAPPPELPVVDAAQDERPERTAQFQGET
jgi:hypothetical protein